MTKRGLIAGCEEVIEDYKLLHQSMMIRGNVAAELYERWIAVGLLQIAE